MLSSPTCCRFIVSLTSRHIEVHSYLTVLNHHLSLAAELNIWEPLQLEREAGSFLRAELHSYEYFLRPLPRPGTGPGQVVNNSECSLQGLVLDHPGASLLFPLTASSSSGPEAVAARFSLVLPPGCSLVASLSFHKRYLSRERIPADASRGMHLGSGAVQWRRRGGAQWHDVYPPPALISVPFPDASMPFNVITMVSAHILSYGA